MTEAFRTVLNMSITGGIAALAVVLLRIPLKRSPRWISCVLWMVVFLRLLLPFSFSSPLSILNGIGAPSPENGVVAYLPADTAEIADGATEMITSAAQELPLAESSADSTNSLEPTPRASADPIQIWFAIGTSLWLAGAAGILLHAVILYAKLRRRVRDAVFVEPGVFETDAIDSPFVLGMFRPRIILPLSLLRQERELVLKHEQAHIYRYDYLMKPLAFLILAVHWFNPLVWIAFRLFCDDTEASCDERAIRSLDRDQVAQYGETLLRLGTRKAAFAAGPLAFGEHCTKERIVNVLNYKKPAFWIVVAALLVAIVAAIVLLANPILRPTQAVEPSIKELDLVNMQPSAFDQQAYDQSKAGGWWVTFNPSPLVLISMDPNILGDSVVTAQSIADFGNQLANGQTYIKAYLKKNANGCYDNIIANGKTHYVIALDDYYSYAIKSYPHRIRVGFMYWRCSEEYVLMVLHPESLHWQHVGYANYLGSVLNPYDVMLSMINKEWANNPEFANSTKKFLNHDGIVTSLTNEDYRTLVDYSAYYNIKNGTNNELTNELGPITEVYGFTEPAEEGDDMSVMMASSFCAYLADKYGFDKLTSYCSGQIDFRQAFGTSFDKAFARWEKELVKEFS